MKFITVALAGLIVSNLLWSESANSQSRRSRDVSVDGYYRRNGTYVAPYIRTAPNQTRDDNYSTRGNTNPYTGRQGTQEGDSTTYSYPSFQPSYQPSFEPSYQPSFEPSYQPSFEPSYQLKKKCTLTTSDGRTISSAWFCGQ